MTILEMRAELAVLDHAASIQSLDQRNQLRLLTTITALLTYCEALEKRVADLESAPHQL